MTKGIEITKWKPLRTFEKDIKGLPADTLTEIKNSLKKLIENPKSGKLRLKTVTGSKKPKIYAIHVTGNHTHKITFELDGTTAILRRFGTHREIDRAQ